METLALKQQACAAIQAHAEEIRSLGEAILHEPELGFKETKTAEKVAAVLKQHAIPYTTGHAITGVKASLTGSQARRTVAVLGELDAVTCFEHPHADPLTGAAHACGHFAQIAAMVGCGIGLAESGVMAELSGNVVLFAVPAEEYVEMDYRNRLRSEGKIAYLGGKAELIRRGDFDDVDMAMMFHLNTDGQNRRVVKVGGTSNGFIGKLARFVGREAHAAGAPHQGINALNAALLAIMAVHAQRETFRDEDYVRFHPIITKGGDLVNVIPSDVRMESYVRGRTLDAILDANKKVDRALRAGADAIGASVEITDLAGYLPLINDPVMSGLFAANAAALLGPDAVEMLDHQAASTDMGDLAHIMPVIHPWVGGVSGYAHTRDFQVVDQEMAYILSAQIMAMTVIDLLADGAAKAEEILAAFQPKMTRDSYIEFMESIGRKE
ncbi:MAG: amidohydrolase [Negativicutes bacterium]|nr:amidohydrolase [Negativicutes bacterium]